MRQRRDFVRRLGLGLMVVMLLGISTLFTVCLLVTEASAGTLRDNFDDGNMDGWQRLHNGNRARWSVKNGELVCISKSRKGWASTLYLGGNTALLGDRPWRDYEFQCQFKLVETFRNIGADALNASSLGIAVRSTGRKNHLDDVAFGVWSHGAAWDSIGCAVGLGEKHDTHNRRHFFLQHGRWYTMRMIAAGNRYQTFIDERSSSAASTSAWVIFRKSSGVSCSPNC